MDDKVKEAIDKISIDEDSERLFNPIHRELIKVKESAGENNVCK